MMVSLKDEKVIDSWGMLIEAAGGRQSHLLENIERYLEQAELPDIFWQQVQVMPGMIKGLLGKKRVYLMITNGALKDFRMYVGARDYGRHLDVSWFLTLEPGVIKRALSGIITQGQDHQALTFRMDLFDQQDLRAYVTSVHRFCVRRAVQGLLEELGQEPPNSQWQSKGFLQVW
jgi:hypothetical protein